MGRVSRLRIGIGAVIGAVIAAALFYVAQQMWWDLDPPERGIMGEGLYPNPVDAECVARVLQHEFGKDVRVTGGGGGSIPAGTEELEIGYYTSPDEKGWAEVDILELKQGTRVTQWFLGHGGKLAQSEFPPALKAMKKATDVVKQACGLDLSRIRLKEVGQRVDALQ